MSYPEIKQSKLKVVFCTEFCQFVVDQDPSATKQVSDEGLTGCLELTPRAEIQIHDKVHFCVS